VFRARNLPDPDRLSVLAALILLGYVSTRLVEIPTRTLSVQLPGLYLAFDLSIHTLVTLLVAGMTASGAEWLLHDHPALQGRRSIEHWLLPALTAWVIGVPLERLPFGPQWLAAFTLGGGLLMLVLIAEYITIDTRDARHAPAAAGLTALSFALYLMLVISLRSADLRLFFILPAVTLAGALAILRTLHLRLGGQWAFWQTLTLALVLAQLAAALHYLPLSPITYGLAILGPAYALTSLVGNLAKGAQLREAVIEPVVVLGIVWGTALWVR
jgi:hypothetical protein